MIILAIFNVLVIIAGLVMMTVGLSKNDRTLLTLSLVLWVVWAFILGLVKVFELLELSVHYLK